MRMERRRVCLFLLLRPLFLHSVCLFLLWESDTGVAPPSSEDSFFLSRSKFFFGSFDFPSLDSIHLS